MKTKNKIALLFGSLLFISVLILVGYQYIRVQEQASYLRVKSVSDQQILDKVLSYKVESFLKPTKDNSAWDDMAAMVRSDDTAWAATNLFK